MRKGARAAKAAMVAVAAGGALLATPASGVAADTAAVEPRDRVTIMGPYDTRAACITEREEFARYYETSDCYMPDPILAWYFDYRTPA